MRITVNLATRPFIELRPFFLRLRVLMAVLAVVGVGAIVAAHILQKKLDVAQAQLNQVHANVVAARQEKQGNEQRMRQPANAAVLARAHFLNTLFLTKSFSWTAVMMDLETVLPIGVQVTSIEPSISTDGNVIIRLRVSGERDRAVQLVRNLERSKRFLAPRLTGEASQTKESAGQGGGNPGFNAGAMNNNAGGANNGAAPGVEFEILADYNPLPEGETYGSGKPAKAVDAEMPRRAKPAKTKGGGIVLKPYSATHPNAATRLNPVAGGAR
jgi:type IV pilus assembly protein PilN